MEPKAAQFRQRSIENAALAFREVHRGLDDGAVYVYASSPFHRRRLLPSVWVRFGSGHGWLIHWDKWMTMERTGSVVEFGVWLSRIGRPSITIERPLPVDVVHLLYIPKFRGAEADVLALDLGQA
jgi:hypothetical protein